MNDEFDPIKWDIQVCITIAKNALRKAEEGREIYKEIGIVNGYAQRVAGQTFIKHDTGKKQFENNELTVFELTLKRVITDYIKQPLAWLKRGQAYYVLQVLADYVTINNINLNDALEPLVEGARIYGGFNFLAMKDEDLLRIFHALIRHTRAGERMYIASNIVMLTLAMVLRC